MKKQEFFNELQEALEFENTILTEKINIKEIDGYDSLSVMTIIAFVDDKFGKKLNAKQLFEISTVLSLMELIGIENFDE